MKTRKPKTIFNYSIITILFLSCIFGSGIIQAQQLFTTVYVDDDYDENTPGWGEYCFDMIQDGIAAVEETGTVYVYNGTYYENIVVDKAIELTAENRNTTIIDGGNLGNVVFINADSVSVIGFTIQNSLISDNNAGIKINCKHVILSENKIVNNHEGIYLYYSDSNYINNNLLLNNNHYGVRLHESNFNLIKGDSVLNNGSYGVSLYHSSYNTILQNNILSNESNGVSIKNNPSSNNNIFYNTISNNNGCGIFIYFSSEHSTITGNTISNNNIGIYLWRNCDYSTISANNIFCNINEGIYIYSSDNNIITNNSIWYNSGNGVKLTIYSTNNQIYHNDIINNAQNAVDFEYASSTSWNDNYPSGGNYWSDYTGTDIFSGPTQTEPGSDGIGDTPYLVPGENNHVDHYPLIHPGLTQIPTLPEIAFVDKNFNQNTSGWAYDHFHKIQWGINSVARYGTINVSKGIYNEHINFYKAVELIGEDRDSTIIDGDWTGNVIEINNDSVTLTGFTIKHSGYENINSGLLINSNNNSITNNKMIDNDGNGVLFDQSSDNLFSANIIMNNYCFGVKILNGSNNNNLFHNDLLNNGQNAFDECLNIWDDFYPSGGNFWDDYIGEDNFSGVGQNIPGSDGIGDTPYLIQGDNNIDNYPLMETFSNINPLPDIVYVDDDFNSNTPGWGYDHFDTIQTGINAVAVDGSVYVANGIYYELLMINRKVDLFGENRDSTIIDGADCGDIFYITADSITITGFAIQNADDAGLEIHSNYNNVSNNVIYSNYENGIKIQSSSNNSFTNNIVINNGRAVLFDGDCNNNKLQNNSFKNNTYGLFIELNCSNNNFSENVITGNIGGIILSSYCNHNSITDNLISDNVSSGLNFDHSEENIITGNIISNHTTAIDFHACHYNTITDNTIMGSNRGIYLPDCMCGGCTNNNIYHNNWINNGQHVYNECFNYWDDGYPSGGNFWDNYTGEDNFSGPNQNIPGSDGIGDTPQAITGGNYFDDYPFMDPIGMSPLVDTVFVDDDYTQNTPGWGYDHFAAIQEAVNMVSFYGTVLVANGIYYENISVNKLLHIKGEDKDSTIIDANGSGTVVLLSADNIVFEGFTIQNSGDNYNGLKINYSDNNHVLHNIIKNNGNNGIVISYSFDNTIEENIIIEHNSNAGIYISNSDNNNIINNEITNNRLGMGVGSSENNFISQNNISNNGYFGGIYHETSSNNTYSGNIISNNEKNGIRIQNNSSSNTIIGNKIFGNGEYGIKIIASNSNMINHNNFCENLLGNAYDNGENEWDNGYSLPFFPSTEAGNFYNDYVGEDIFSGPNQDILGPDGIGDTPYNIAGGDNKDNYPFFEEIIGNITLDLCLFLEGPFNGSNMSVFQNSENLPLSQPFNIDPWNYYGNEIISSIPDENIVDWILIELRDATQAEFATPETTIARKAAFILNDGSVVGIDGVSKPFFNKSLINQLFVVIWHRNHISIMSADSLIEINGINSYNFSIGENQVYGGAAAHKEIGNGIWGMIGGDGDANGQIDILDKDDVWKIQAGNSGYQSGDFTTEMQVDNKDKNDIWLFNIGNGTQVPEIDFNNRNEKRLTWRFANPAIIQDETNVFQFDIELKCNELENYHSQMQIYFDYDTLAFGSNIDGISQNPDTNERINYSFLELMDTNKYMITNDANNLPNRYSIITQAIDENYPIPLNELTGVDTSFKGFLRIQIDIQDTGQLAGIGFSENLMNGGEYYLEFETDTIPNKYFDTCYYFNNMMKVPLSNPNVLYANFSVNKTEVAAGEFLQFTDISFGEIIHWEWDFNNDGIIDSEEQNPEWAYYESGLQSVSLTIYNEQNQDTELKEYYINVGQTDSQNYELRQGFQFVSSRVIPLLPDMLDLLGDNLNDNLDFVRNSSGETLRKIGSEWINGIGDWNTVEGYLFRMNNNDELLINGFFIDPETPIELNIGYQIISYLPDYTNNVGNVFYNILDNLTFVRNSYGKEFRKIGPIWVNNIGEMEPEEGYLVKMHSDDILIYTFSCGNPFTDLRNGQIYNTVQIGTQCWMAENINIGTIITGIENMSNNEIIEKYCYDNDPANCEVFGGLYQWDEMMQYSTTQSTQGICPDDWHLPSDEEWFELENFLDPSINNPELFGWRGTDCGLKLLEGGTSKFEALLAGLKNWNNGEFTGIGESTVFWTSTINPFNPVHSWFRKLVINNSQSYRNGASKLFGASVRCLMNEATTQPSEQSSKILLENGRNNRYLTQNISFSSINFVVKEGNPAEPIWTIYFDKGTLGIGDEIGIYDKEKLVGSGVISSDNILENSISVFSNLYKTGNKPIIKIWNKSANTEFVLNNYSLSNPYGDAWIENVFPSEDGKYSLVYFSTTGILKKNSIISSFNIYPNPSEGIFNILIDDVDGLIQIKIFDIHGNDYSYFEIQGTKSTIIEKLDLKELPAGVYFISFNGKDFSQVKKIVIQ
ncbi:MAG: right-handed parallel beta-helix repeat-containing protein [Bacteroidales bacterium]|nr:right-handed parallel beta-helix repeat-containing protein [Bacteroidales bacterium]